MILTDEEIQEFKKITKEVYDRDLTNNEAIENGTRIIFLAELLIYHMKYGNLSEKVAEKEEQPEDFDH